LQYTAIDGRFVENWEKILIERSPEISADVSDELTGGLIHFFRLKANNTEVEVIIFGNKIRVHLTDKIDK
jgi:hypothetical protein